MSDWSRESVVSPPTNIVVNYSVENNGVIEKKSVSLVSTVTSETESNYTTFSYTDEEGRAQSQDVVTSRSSETRNTVATVNGALVKWRLSNKLGLPSGDATKTSISTYEYTTTAEGPKLIFERTKEYITDYELAGSLAITDYTGWEPSGNQVVSSITEITYDERKQSDGRSYTKTVTTRWMALGLTQEGQQSAAEQLKEEDGTGLVLSSVFDAMCALTCDGAEVRTTIGQAGTQGRPSAQDRVRDEIENDSSTDPDQLGYGDEYSNDGGGGGGGDNSFTVDLPDPPNTVGIGFDFGGGDSPTPDWPSSEVEYQMPFAPDDYLVPDGAGGTVLVPGNAQDAAREYALMQNALKAGNAFGVNITTSVDRLPSQIFAPLYLNAAGMSVACRVNGTSWAFDSSGIVVSSDLMLCGVAGVLAES